MASPHARVPVDFLIITAIMAVPAFFIYAVASANWRSVEGGANAATPTCRRWMVGLSTGARTAARSKSADLP